MSSKLTRIVEFVSSPLFRTARVTDVEEVTSRVRLVSFSAEWAPPGSWRPGDKVQIRMSGLSARTYTPLPLDGAAPGFRLVGFSHGDGPGSNWLRGLRVGSDAAVSGPRRSLNYSDVNGPIIMVGDETSVGLAAALTDLRDATTEYIFEATDLRDVRAPAERLGVSVDHVIARTSGNAHRASVAEAVADRLAGGATLLLSGDAATVAAVRRHLKDTGVHPVRTLAKAYWAEGRRGLD